MLETLRGMRVVGPPETLDGLEQGVLGNGVTALRFAPDDLFAVGAGDIEIADEAAILAEESGFVGAWLTATELERWVLPHIEWPLPTGRPAVAQGLVAGVPAKLWLDRDRALLLCAAAYGHELAERLR